MNLTEIFQIGIGILRTVIADTGAILAQTGDAASNVTEADEVPIWAHVGFVYRPSAAEAGRRSAEAIAIRRGNGDIIIATRDLRGLELAGELGEGEVCVYAPGADGKGQARALFKSDGSIHLYTRVGGTEEGAGMTVQINAAEDSITVLNGEGNGLLVAKDAVTLTCGESALTLNASGDIQLIGTGQAQMDGSSILLGAQGVQGLNSAIMGPAGIAGAANPKIILGL